MNVPTRLSIPVQRKTQSCPSPSIQQRLEWIERFSRSGQSQRTFAQTHGLNLGQFRYWLYDRSLEPKGLGGAPRLQEVSLVARTAQPGWSAEVSLPAGLTVRLNERLARELIGPLLSARPTSHV